VARTLWVSRATFVELPDANETTGAASGLAFVRPAPWQIYDSGQNPQIVLGALQLVDSRCRCAIQKCITVVEPGRNNAACDCEKCGRSVDSALPKKCHLKSR